MGKKSGKEYTGKLPQDLVGKRRFVCECCQKRYPITSLDIHHRLPQACGGTDDRQNLCTLCNGCHQTLHRIALSLASLKQKKVSANTLAREYAESVTPDDVEGTKSRILMLATKVAMAISEKRNGKIAVGESDIVLSDVPPKFKKMLLEDGKRIKGASGKGIGASGIALVAVMTALEKRHPEASDEIRQFLSDRGVCNYAPKPVESGINFRTRR